MAIGGRGRIRWCRRIDRGGIGLGRRDGIEINGGGFHGRRIRKAKGEDVIGFVS